MEPSAGGWHELQVANPSFLVEKLGAECGDLQGLRELTVNGIEAITALGPRHRGRVIWDLDWERAIQSDGRVRKLSVIDTGTGMTPEQMYQFINQLAASGREQSRTGNFGVGAKIAAGSRNPHGLEYRSWQQGHGALVRFMCDQNGHWGLQAQPQPDGTAGYWRPLTEADKPWALRGADHGTQVVLLGTSDTDDTTVAPASVTEGRRHWIVRYLNSRFARLPDTIELLVREPGPPGEWHDPRTLAADPRAMPPPRRARRRATGPSSCQTRSWTGGCSTPITAAAAAKPPSGPPPATPRRC